MLRRSDFAKHGACVAAVMESLERRLLLYPLSFDWVGGVDDQWTTIGNWRWLGDQAAPYIPGSLTGFPDYHGDVVSFFGDNPRVVVPPNTRFEVLGVFSNGRGHLEVQGSISLQGAAYLPNTVEVAPGGTLDYRLIGDGAHFENLTNRGTVIARDGGFASSEFINEGTLLISPDTHEFGPESRFTGSIENAGEIRYDGTLVPDKVLTFTDFRQAEGGALRILGGRASVQFGSDSGGDLWIADGASAGVSGLLRRLPAIHGPGSLTLNGVVEGEIRLEGVSVTGGITSVEAGTIATIVGNFSASEVTFMLMGDGQLNIAGRAMISGRIVGGSVRVLAGARLTLLGAHSGERGLAYRDATRPSVVESGAELFFTREAGSRVLLARGLENHGTIVWEDVDLIVSSDFSSGSIFNASDGLLVISHTTDHTVANSPGIDFLNNAGRVEISGAGHTTIAAGVVNSGILDVRQGWLSLTGLIDDRGAFREIRTGTWIVRDQASLDFGTRNIDAIRRGVAVELYGSRSRFFGLSTLTDNYGTLVLGDGRAFTSSNPWLSVSAGKAFTNYGTLTKTGTGRTRITTPVRNAGDGTRHGTVRVEGGTLELASLTDEVFFSARRSIAVVVQQGTLKINSGYAANNSVRLGSAGTLRCPSLGLANLSRTLIVELAGRSSGQFGRVVTTAASLSGTITFDLVNSFRPRARDRFVFFMAQRLTGTFASMNVAELAAGVRRRADLVYDTAGVALDL